EIWSRLAEGALPAARRFFVRSQAPRIRRLEASLVRKASGLSCVSTRDRESIAAIGAAVEPLVVPNGVDLSRYAFRDGSAGSEKILFVGDLSWPPNAEAVRWFAEKVWPMVHERRPSASVEIVGREAPRDLVRLVDERFAFAGESGDRRPHW